MKDEAISDLITDMFRYKTSVNAIKNKVLQGKNLNVGAKQFNDILNSRFKKFCWNGL